MARKEAEERATRKAEEERRREAGVLREVREMSSGLRRQRGWSDLSQTSDLAQISLNGVSVGNGRVIELVLANCGLKGES